MKQKNRSADDDSKISRWWWRMNRNNDINVLKPNFNRIVTIQNHLNILKAFSVLSCQEVICLQKCIKCNEYIIFDCFKYEFKLLSLVVHIHQKWNRNTKFHSKWYCLLHTNERKQNRHRSAVLTFAYFPSAFGWT